MLRVEVCTRALRASQNLKREACLVCSLCLSGYMGGFSEDAGWLTFFVWRSTKFTSAITFNARKLEVVRYYGIVFEATM